MIVFVGGGALLSHAVTHALTVGAPVALLCCPEKDPALPRLRRLGVNILTTRDPNADLFNRLGHGDVVFSINNRALLGDPLLKTGARFFNVHNGLVQHYRGIAEVCVFAAICRAEGSYGATLHRILPGQKVDSGPVIAQVSFDIAPGDHFHDVFRRSIEACQRLFLDSLSVILARQCNGHAVELTGKAYSYRDVPRLCAEADPERLGRATALGAYRIFLKELAQQLAAPGVIEAGQGPVLRQA